jgi:hypothetical protein
MALERIGPWALYVSQEDSTYQIQQAQEYSEVPLQACYVNHLHWLSQLRFFAEIFSDYRIKQLI